MFCRQIDIKDDIFIKEKKIEINQKKTWTKAEL